MRQKQNRSERKEKNHWSIDEISVGHKKCLFLILIHFDVDLLIENYVDDIE